MTIVELGALGEFLGSIVVLFTLVYLAVQVKQGNRSLEESRKLALAQTYQMRSDALQMMLVSASDSENIGPIITRLTTYGYPEDVSALDRLNDEERGRFRQWQIAQQTQLGQYVLPVPAGLYRRGILPGLVPQTRRAARADMGSIECSGRERVVCAGNRRHTGRKPVCRRSGSVSGPTVYVTPLYAAVIALLFVLLSVRTLRLRHRFQVAIGPGDEPLLARAMRVHANFAEYVPIALLLMLFVEMGTRNATLVHALGVLLLAGRSLHAYGVSQVKENFRFRVTGMALTFTVIIAAALILLAVYAIALTSAQSPAHP